MIRRLIGGAALLALAGCGGGEQNTGGEAARGGGMTAGEVAKEIGQVKLSPGQWRIESEVVEIDSPGMPKEAVDQMAGRKTTLEMCIKPEDVERPEIFSGQQSDACTYRDFTMRGGRMSGAMTCKGGENGGAMTIAMEGQYSAERYDISTDMKMEGAGGQGGMAIKARAAGARIGDCPAAAS